MLQVIFTFFIGIINKYYNVKLSDINKKLSLLFMNHGNLTTRIKIHLAQCMETRFAKDVFCQKYALQPVLHRLTSGAGRPMPPRCFFTIAYLS